MSNTPIEHIIVLMLENRSFDHMCGYWNHLPSGSGLTGEEFNYVDPTDTVYPTYAPSSAPPVLRSLGKAIALATAGVPA